MTDVTGATKAGRRSAEDQLALARRLVVPPLRSWVGHLPVHTRHVAEYHFGWRDGAGRALRGGGAVGKLVRPALALGCARAVGGRPEDAVDAAVAVELVHNFSLLHDDVIDRDGTRRHRPTVWREFGVPAAVLTGDALLSLAFRVLAEGPAGRDGAAVRVLAAAVTTLIEGEGADVSFETRDDVGAAECAAMAADKTGALMGAACALGALTAGGDPAGAERLAAFGRHLGTAFQAVDDLLGIFGDPGVLGKPVGADLAARKKSLPVVAALASDCPAGAELRLLYADREPLDGARLARAVELVAAAGGRDAARELADVRCAAAHACLRQARAAPAAADELSALADLLTRRQY
ncbi:polyprenyl synthetase family protein [Streptomyces sp. GMY02]|uniref:polyprenyl synthetase family protein n=1 Tax=Streptomyces sp. GMY02 TaxID=1333528 RepID=UPI001C2BEAF0|nr:polyprenyl synthetase family protein [Streptomyces sp. GMY02]QXE33467.1 polyprenyl synthetase family protein [Streptomyces sp. GMY02]